MMENIELTEEVMKKLGFSDYDDEHGTWGNRRLGFNMDSDAGWKKLQIIEYGDYPEENGCEAGFVYAGWFDNIRHDGDGNAHWDLKTLQDLYDCIKAHRPELLEEFEEKVKEGLGIIIRKP